jgi:hypothetical protein
MSNNFGHSIFDAVNPINPVIDVSEETVNNPVTEIPENPI